MTAENMKDTTAQAQPEVSITQLERDVGPTAVKVDSGASELSTTFSGNLLKDDKHSYSRNGFDIPMRKFEVSGSTFSSEYGRATHTGYKLQVLSGHIEVGS